MKLKPDKHLKGTLILSVNRRIFFFFKKIYENE